MVCSNCIHFSSKELFISSLLSTFQKQEREIRWKLARVPVGNKIQLTGPDRERVRVNPFVGPLIERRIKVLCTAARGRNMDLWYFPKPENFIEQDMPTEVRTLHIYIFLLLSLVLIIYFFYSSG